ncbi:MAG: response regulator [Spirochaetota bacterium]|nr:response regulator [Spirochaetota bacterium]
MDEKILFVDDDANILSSFKRQLRNKYNLVTAESGIQGIAALTEDGPFAVVVSDFRMPEMDGIEFLSKAREISPDTVRLMLTGQADMESSIKAINEGNIFRFLTKPCYMNDLKNALNAGIEQYRLITAEREILDRTLKGSIKILIDVLSIVSPITFSRAFRLRKMARGIAERLKIERFWEIEIAAMLSQIGCVTLPTEILEKKYKGVELPVNERVMFYKHPQIGKKFLSNIPRLEEISDAIVYQFKQFDGGGLPEDDKKGKAIPLIGRIIKAVLDYDLLKSKGETNENSLKIMQSHIQWYDPEIFAALEAEVLSVEEGYIVKSIMMKDILIGMVLADDVKDLRGKILITKGNEITEVLKTRLMNFSSLGDVVEPIKVIDQIDKMSE